jgi:hypothetical protein
MTDIAVREPRRESLLRRPDAPSLEAWAEEMTAAAQIARGIAGTPFVPASLRVMHVGEIDLAATTANIAATLLTGKEVGLEPMAALRSIVVINGTPAINALAARALVVARGHELWLVESTATRCVYQGRRHGSDRTQQSVWTIDRAKDLGLAGKPNWRQQPIAMLIARATAECARLVAPEVLLGLPYIVEELEDVTGDAAPTEPAGPACAAHGAASPAAYDPAAAGHPPRAGGGGPRRRTTFGRPAGTSQARRGRAAAGRGHHHRAAARTASRVQGRRNQRPEKPPRNHPANHRPAHQLRHPTDPR